jgi:predicted membrane metal-binding protein
MVTNYSRNKGLARQICESCPGVKTLRKVLSIIFGLKDSWLQMAIIKPELKEITSFQVPVLVSVGYHHRKKRNRETTVHLAVVLLWRAVYISHMSGDLAPFSTTATCVFSFWSATEKAVMHNGALVPSESL